MKTLIKNILIFSSFLFVITIFSDVAIACRCDLNKTVDMSFDESSNVVILKLQSVKEYDAETDEPGRYFLSVEKVFKGNLKVGENLTFKPGPGNCSWTFSGNEIGSEYLFYLGDRPKNGELWEVPSCSVQAKSKTADLLYLEKEKKMRGKTRLSGRFVKFIYRPNEEVRRLILPQANKKIRISGQGRNIEIITDENGVYEIYDLPPGKYKLFPEPINGFTFLSDNSEFLEVEIKAKSHTERFIFYEINNAVSGKIIDRSGKPLENVDVDLILSRNETEAYYSNNVRTNRKGEFEIRGIPEGSYYLVINREGKITLSEPFDTFYYPNVKNEQEATEITVGMNYFLRDLIITPPEIFETITLTGNLIYSDGQPAADQRIQFLKEEENSESSDKVVIFDSEVKTDENGRFIIKILRTVKGVLRGVMYRSVGEYKSCTEIESLINPEKNSRQQLNTPDFIIDGTEILSGIELKFPFAKCEEADKR